MPGAVDGATGRRDDGAVRCGGRRDRRGAGCGRRRDAGGAVDGATARCRGAVDGVTGGVDSLLSGGSLLDANIDINADADLTAPVAGAVAANANIAAPIDASVAANIGSDGAVAQSLADQQVDIHQDLDDVSAEATAEQDADDRPVVSGGRSHLMSATVDRPAAQPHRSRGPSARPGARGGPRAARRGQRLGLQGRASALVRRADGQMVQLGPLLYGLLEEVDGERDCAALAAAMSERLGRRLEAEHVVKIGEKLAAQGLLAGSEDNAPPQSNPLLALRWKVLVHRPEGDAARSRGRSSSCSGRGCSSRRCSASPPSAGSC